MNVIQFISAKRSDWDALEALLSELRQGAQLKGVEFRKLSKLYRGATADFAYSQTYFPDHDITHYLNKLVAESHGLIYQRKKFKAGNLFDWFFKTVPGTFMAHWAYFLAALIVFVIFGFVGFYGSRYVPEGEKIFLNFSLINPEDAFAANASYIRDTENYIRQGRPFHVYHDEYKTSMASRIMFNNIRVAILVFVAGIFAGVVSFYLTATTGMMVGAFYHIFYRHEITFHFWNTVMLHGMIELSMIVIACGAGFMIARALLFPDNYTMRDSLKIKGKYAIQIAIVMGLWLIVAGTIEATVTGAPLLWQAKLAFNCCSFLALFGYWIVLGWYNRKTLLTKEVDIP